MAGTQVPGKQILDGSIQSVDLDPSINLGGGTAATFYAGRPKSGTTIGMDVPGVVSMAFGTESVPTGQIIYTPFIVRLRRTLDQIGVEVTTAGIAALANPTIAPNQTGTYTSWQGASGNVLYGYTESNANGETLISPTFSVAVVNGSPSPTIGGPVLPSSSTRKWYMSDGPNSATLRYATSGAAITPANTPVTYVSAANALPPTVNTAVGSSVRLGIARLNTDLQPTALVLDAGLVSTGVVGQKLVSINQVLDPGLYASMISTNSATAAFRRISGSSPDIDGLMPTLGASPFIAFMGASPIAYGAYATSPPAWTVLSPSGLPFKHFIQYRTSAFG